MKEYLVFINYQRINYKGDNTYEFIFADNKDVEYGDNWDYIPSKSAVVTPPNIDYITSVYKVTSREVEFEIASYSGSVSMLDAVDKVISLAYEIEPPNDLTVKRLVFYYGDDKDEVLKKLFERDDITIKEEKINYE